MLIWVLNATIVPILNGLSKKSPQKFLKYDNMFWGHCEDTWWAGAIVSNVLPKYVSQIQNWFRLIYDLLHYSASLIDATR